MSDDTELQAAEVEDVIVTAETEQPEQVSESATDSEQEHEQTPDTSDKAPEVSDNDPERFTERMNKKHWELMEAKRRADDLERRLQEIEQSKPQQQRPDIPPPPDPFDDDYEAKFRQRDDALRKAAEFDAAQKVSQYYRQQQEQAKQAEKQQALVKTAQTYTERAAKLGVKPEQLQVAGNVVASAGLNQDLVEYILGDEQGPLITTYLANAPAELEALMTASPYVAGVKLAEIKQKAVASRQAKKAPPDPAEPLKGGGAKADDGPTGAKFW